MRRFRRLGLALLALCLIAVVVIGMFHTASRDTPISSRRQVVPDIPSNAERMRHDVEMLTAINPPRNAANVESLNRSAAYIIDEFGKTGCHVQAQHFTHEGKGYKNVVCSFGPEGAERIVVGAHYDVCGDQPGADDNASGVAGVLELARLIGRSKTPLKYRIDFAAFTLEERQFPREILRTRHLGSYTYAKSLAESGVSVRWMMALEMIGYFTEKPKSQRYPLFFLGWFYPDTGNYIAVVGKYGQGGLVARVKESMAAACAVPVVSTTAPQFLPGIDFSDHEAFWRFGYNAVMITDTAFYRNRNYHRATDTADTLDYAKMAEVVKGLYRAVVTVE
jgi:hypothetical protein